MSTYLKGWNGNASFSGHLPRKIYVAKIKEIMFAQYTSTGQSSLETGPLVPSSLNHLILSVSVNVTFTCPRLSPTWRRQGPYKSVCHPVHILCSLLPPRGSKHSHSFYFSNRWPGGPAGLALPPSLLPRQGLRARPVMQKPVTATWGFLRSLSVSVHVWNFPL